MSENWTLTPIVDTEPVQPSFIVHCYRQAQFHDRARADRSFEAVSRTRNGDNLFISCFNFMACPHVAYTSAQFDSAATKGLHRRKLGYRR